MDITVRDNPEQTRYEAVLADGEVAGYAEYRRRGDTRVFHHTVVEPEYEGQGVAGTLVRGALDDVRSQGARVIAQCSYVRGWIGKHPDYQDLVETAA